MNIILSKEVWNTFDKKESPKQKNILLDFSFKRKHNHLKNSRAINKKIDSSIKSTSMIILKNNINTNNKNQKNIIDKNNKEKFYKVNRVGSKRKNKKNNDLKHNHQLETTIKKKDKKKK